MKEIKLSLKAVVVAVIVVTLSFARRERIVVNDGYSQGYRVVDYWGTPVKINEGIATFIANSLGLIVAIIGIGILLTYLYIGTRRGIEIIREDEVAVNG